jgi:hypothetical protein
MEAFALPLLSAVELALELPDSVPLAVLVPALFVPAVSVPPVPPVASPVPSARAPAVEEASESPDFALDPAFADAEAPSPLALALALAFEVADPPPALADEVLCDSALALAASAVISVKLTLISGTRGVAIKAKAMTLAETMSPKRKLLGRCMGNLHSKVDTKSRPT